MRQGNYHTFERGSLSASCRKTDAYPEVSQKFMPHHRGQMDSFTDSTPPPAGVTVVDNPTYLLARDEDCENLFHSMADHVGHATGIRKGDDWRVYMTRKGERGPYIEVHSVFSRATC